MVRETRSLLKGTDSSVRDTIIPFFISNRSKSFLNREMFDPIARYKSLKGFFDQEIHFEVVVSANEIDVRSPALMEKQFDSLLYTIVFE